MDQGEVEGRQVICFSSVYLAGKLGEKQKKFWVYWTLIKEKKKTNTKQS